jgi:aryl-alcohol dehydrogenase-like predicted oxidoreductase
MDTRRIGSLEVSVVGLGTNNFGRSMTADQVPPVVDAALESGITFFDTADIYGDSEERLGQALGRRRDRVVLATKFGSSIDGAPAGASPDYVRAAADRSLRRLGTDHIDLYQLHTPDPLTPIADTLGALDELIAAGKVREIGCSNFDAGQLRDAAAAADASGGHRFVSVQNHYNLLHRSDEEEVLPECRREGLAYLPYFPLASGLLSGKYAAGEAPPPGTRLDRWGGDRAKGVMTDRNFGVIDALDGWAADHGHSVLELAVAWLLADPIIPSVIAGATSPEQVRANATAGNWRLDPVQRSEIDSLALPA